MSGLIAHTPPAMKKISRHLAMILLLPLWWSPFAAQAVPDTVSDNADFQFLADIQEAARQLDYAGVLTYTQEGSSQAMRLVHIVDGTGERERLELLDGTPREYLRTNHEVKCLIPERQLVIIEQQRNGRFPAPLLGDAEQLSTHYEVAALGGGYRVAGHDCNLYEITPKDTLRYGYRFCADSRTSLLLQAETLDNAGVVLQQVAFANIDYDDRVVLDLLQPRLRYENWRVIEADLNEADLHTLGWTITPPAGFQLISQVTRSMRAGRQVSQAVYSDGLAAISVFIEPVEQQGGRLKEDKGSRRGSMNFFRTRMGDYWLTTTGEVPLQTLREFGQSTVYNAPSDTH